MQIDTLTQFSNKQVATASGASSLAVDLGIARNIGVGSQNLYLVICLVASAGTTSAITAALRTSATGSTAALTGSINTLITDSAFAAGAAAGTIHVIPLPVIAAYLRYIDVYFTWGSGSDSKTFTAFIATDADLQTFYPVGYTVA